LNMIANVTFLHKLTNNIAAVRCLLGIITPLPTRTIIP
jgi:hypothetical protein